MKNQILEISQLLENDEIQEEEARKLLLRLFLNRDSLSLPSFLREDGEGGIATAVYGDSEVTEEWEEWLSDIVG